MKKKKSKKREIHIGEEIWTYKIGKQYIGIWSPEGKKCSTDISEVTGWRWDNIERAIWKGNWQGIKPSDIKTYIEKSIIGV